MRSHGNTGLLARELLLCSAALLVAGQAWAADVKEPLKGKIIISSKVIYQSSDAETFVNDMLEQHQPEIKPDYNDQYKMHYVAFFKKLQAHAVFVVVVNEDGDLLQTGQVFVKPGQTSLQSYLIVEERPKPGKKHHLKVISVKGKKETVHASGEVTLLPK